MYLYNEENLISEDFSLMNLLRNNPKMYDEFETISLIVDVFNEGTQEIAKWERKTGWECSPRNESLLAVLSINEMSQIFYNHSSTWENITENLAYLFAAIVSGDTIEIDKEDEFVGIVDNLFDSYHNIWSYIEVI